MIFYCRFVIYDLLFPEFSICDFHELDHPKNDKERKPEITNRKSQIENHKSKITNRKSQIENHKSTIENLNPKP